VVDIVLPVLNEAEAIPGVLGSIPNGYHPIVVDNGSTDDSSALALGLGAQVISEPIRGFGAACYAGLLASSADIVCFMDCDGSLDPGEIAAVAAPVLAGGIDLMLGARQAEPGAWPLHARLGNRAVASAVRRRTGLRLRDIGPMRAARRTALIALDIRDRRFGWPLEMVLRAAEEGWRIAEVPVTYRARAGRSKVTGTPAGTLRTVRDMLAVLRTA
jgi:glycosyltransferase involved in cell wall biosynthesis